MISAYAAFQHTLQFRKGLENIYTCDFLGIPKHFSEVSLFSEGYFQKKNESYDLYIRFKRL